MRKRLCLLAASFAAALLFAGCTAPAEKTDGLKVVATVYPGYDWAANIMEGCGAEPELMLRNGVDMHSFQPTAADMVNLSDADLFIYVGGESDAWVADALNNARNEDLVAVNMTEVLAGSLQQEEHIEGMQTEHDDEGHADEDHDHDADHAHPVDEHVWLSVKNAEKVCAAISEALCQVDADNAALYAANCEAYTARLAALDEDYQALVDGAARKTLLFGDRFPFLYLTHDYGIEYHAAFPGCSAETEASFATISFLAGKLDELQLPVVLTIDGSDQRIARTIVENSTKKDAEILTLDSMQSVTDAEIEAGTSYLSIMEENLAVLEKALS